VIASASRLNATVRRDNNLAEGKLLLHWQPKPRPAPPRPPANAPSCWAAALARRLDDGFVVNKNKTKTILVFLIKYDT